MRTPSIGAVKKQIVTIEKWVGDTKSWYWIVGSNGEGIDGFSTKKQAIDAIKRWGMIRVNKTVKVRK
jgi:hypothetical protein